MKLEREGIHLVLMEEAERGLEDVDAGRTKDARKALQVLRTRREELGGSRVR